MITLDTQLKIAGTTQYSGFAPDSMIKFNDKYYAAGSTGLYEVACRTGVTGYFEIAKFDLDTHRDKRIRFFYIGLYAAGNLVLTVSTENNAETDIAIPITTTGQQEVRVSCPRNIRGVNWTLKISNTGTQADFSIDYIKLLPTVK